MNVISSNIQPVAARGGGGGEGYGLVDISFFVIQGRYQVIFTKWHVYVSDTVFTPQLNFMMNQQSAMYTLHGEIDG